MNSVVTLTDRPQISMEVEEQSSSVLENVNSVLVNLKTTSCQQLLNYDVVSAALLPTDDWPRKYEAHCYTNRHAKIML